MAGSLNRFVCLLRNFGNLLWPLSLLIAVQPLGAEEAIPLPRKRPQLGTQDRSPTPSIDLAPSPCQLRLAELAMALARAASAPARPHKLEQRHRFWNAF